MAKRIADKELTDRNWDLEDEGEEAGMFSIASEDVMKNRTIKKAKRRAGGECETSGAFKGFKGFTLAPSAGAKPPVSGFSTSVGFKPLSGLTNGNSVPAPVLPAFTGFASPATPLTSTSSPASLAFNGPAPSKPKAADIVGGQSNGSAPSPLQAERSEGGSSKEYSRQLTALNCSVRDWITKHVNGNPLCDLNPIFRDYERYLGSIERKFGRGGVPKNPEERGGLPPPTTTTTVLSSGTSSVATTTPSATPPSLFSFSKEKESSAPQPAGVTFNFGQKVDSSVLGSGGAPSFSFSSSRPGSLFGAPAASPPSFGGAKTEAASNNTAPEENENEEDEPPKPVVSEVKEKDAFYSKKCKLFYKKDNAFKEKGVGTLHLKQVTEGKTQLLVRADTNLGNILLNILVPRTMPCSRTGKNNVMIVCVPNPVVDEQNPSSPVPLLIRVKSAEDADELHKILEEKKH